MQNTTLEKAGQTPTDKLCTKCDVTLNDFNWYPSWKEQHNHMCKTCCRAYAETKNPQRMFVAGRYIAKDHPLHQAGSYSSWEEVGIDKLETTVKTTAGYVYVISNPAWPQWFKVGKATVEKERCRAYQTGDPFRNYSLEYSMETTNRHALEKVAHDMLEPVCLKRQGEWFKFPESFYPKALLDAL